MFDKTCRFVYENGLRFYEEDILFDSHIYSANQKVVLELNYLTNGVGLMIGLMPGKALNEQKLYYFIRLDSYSASLFLVNQMHYERLEHVSTPISAPLESLKIEVQITSNQIVLSLNGRNYMYANLNYAIGEHHLGIYSQKNNTFYKMHIEGKAPALWRVNMQAAQNGRITFDKSKVRFSECKYPVELLQEDILLEPGEYHVSYQGEGVSVYVFNTNSIYTDLKDKNLLKPDNSFVIKEQSPVAIYVTGENGFIQNLSLSHLENAPYVESYLTPATKDGSYLKIKMDQLSEIAIEFVVKKECFGTLVSDVIKTYERGFMEGEHSLLVKDNIAYLYFNNDFIDEVPFHSDVIELFKNLELYIYHITIKDKDNNISDWFRKTDKEEWIKPSLNSPILATNEMGNALDLSASFREVNGKYIFTTTERETFEPYPIIKLNEPIIALVGAYGIPKSGLVNENNFYKGTSENMNDLSAYCQSYEPITNCMFDAYLNQVTFYDSLSRYKEIIVDYKKADSYAINFVSELGKYRIETTSDHYSYFYSLDGQEQYARTIYKEAENKYIVLEKEAEILEN